MLRASRWSKSKFPFLRPICGDIAVGQWSASNTRSYVDQIDSSSKSGIPKAFIKPSTVSPPSPGHIATTSSRNLSHAGNFTSQSEPQRSLSDIPELADQTENASKPFAPARKSRKLFRKFLSFIVFLQIIGFGGGVYYSRINDNFHDFFTEFVPFGKQVILYLEDKEFRKRFPARSESDSQNNEKSTTISSQSDISWTIANGQRSGSMGRHVDATNQDANSMKSTNDESSCKPAMETYSSEKENLNPQNKSIHGPSISESIKVEEMPNPATPNAPSIDQVSKQSLKSNLIDPININDAEDPLVQDVVKIVNNIITVLEADNSYTKFSRTIEKAKAELSTIGSRILAHKEKVLQEAEAKIQSEKQDFDRAAEELVRRVDIDLQNQQANWQVEYQNELARIKKAYENKLSLEIQRSNEINEQRLHNALLEQALQMKEQFTQEIKDLVEEERNGRLKKLDDLSSAVTDLEKLTTDWSSVVDYNLRTQQLHIAVEATREIIEKSEVARPFVRELVALREIASDDPVVNAAIASINPIAYHHGLPSPAQIIDRFRRVATEVRKAALLPEDAGVASHASSYVLSKLLFKKKGLVSGSDVESVLTRAETFLEEGNLDAAAREVNELRGWARILSRDWLDEVRRVLEVKQALEVSIPSYIHGLSA